MLPFYDELFGWAEEGKALDAAVWLFWGFIYSRHSTFEKVDFTFVSLAQLGEENERRKRQEKNNNLNWNVSHKNFHFGFRASCVVHTYVVGKEKTISTIAVYLVIKSC